MNNVFEEVMAKLVSIDEIRYVNWDIGQMNGYYMRPSVTFPCVLISFPNLDFEDMSNATQMGTVAMQLKIVTQSLSQTSNLTPALVRAKGNEIWEIEKLIHKKLHTQDGNSFNSMSRVKTQIEPREDGYNVLNTFYAFAKEDYNAQPITRMVETTLELTPEIVMPVNSCPNCPNGLEIALLDYISGVRISGNGTANLGVALTSAVYEDNVNDTTATYTLDDGNGNLSPITIGDHGILIPITGMANGNYTGTIESNNGAKYQFDYLVLGGIVYEHQTGFECSINVDLDCQISPNNSYSINAEGTSNYSYQNVSILNNSEAILTQAFTNDKYEAVVHDLLSMNNTLVTIVDTSTTRQLINTAILNLQCIS